MNHLARSRAYLNDGVTRLGDTTGDFAFNIRYPLVGRDSSPLEFRVSDD